MKHFRIDHYESVWIMSNAGHGHRHSPSHRYVIIGIVVLADFLNPNHYALDQWERLSQ